MEGGFSRGKAVHGNEAGGGRGRGWKYYHFCLISNRPRRGKGVVFFDYLTQMLDGE
jgi:hypothetical protein